jgi:hypothetical protein
MAIPSVLPDSADTLGRVLGEAVPVLSRMGKATTGGTTIVRRGEMIDQAWQHIEPLLPEFSEPRCRPPSGVSGPTGSAGTWR